MIRASYRGGIAWLVIVVSTVLAVQHTWQLTRTPAFAGIDFVQFYLAGQHLHAGRDPAIYDQQVMRSMLRDGYRKASPERPSAFYQAISYRHERGELELTSSPFLYYLFSLFPATDYATSHDIFLAVSILATLVGFLGFGLALGLPRLALFLAALAIADYWPLLMDLKMGNLNQVQVGMLGVTLLLLRARPRIYARAIAGFWLGLCLAFKPTLIFCAAFLAANSALRRDWRGLLVGVAGGGVGAALAGSLTLTVFKASAWAEWLSAVRHIRPENVSLFHGNMSPLFQAVVNWHAPGWVYPLAALVLCALVVISASRPRALASFETEASADAAALAAGCLVFLLSSPLAWYYYHVLCLPAVLVVLAVAIRGRGTATLIWAGALLVLALIWLGVYPIEVRFEMSPAGYLVRCVAANLLLLGLTVWRPWWCGGDVELDAAGAHPDA